MRELTQQLKWQFALLHKNNIIAISVAVTAIYALIFLAIKDLGNMDKFLTVLILNDPAIIGMFFIGVAILMEKKQQVLMALFVTPANHTFLSNLKGVGRFYRRLGLYPGNGYCGSGDRFSLPAFFCRCIWGMCHDRPGGRFCSELFG